MPTQKTTRRAIRFESDENTLTLIDLNPSEEFRPSVVGLNLDESSSGNGVVILKRHLPEVSQQVKIQVGNLSPIEAQCVWIRDLDDHVARVGFAFRD